MSCRDDDNCFTMSLNNPSNLAQRVIVALFGIPVMIWLTWKGELFFLFLVALLAMQGVREFHHLARAKAFVPHVVFFVIYTLLFQLNLSFRVVDSLVPLILLVAGLFVREVFESRGSRIVNIGSALTGVLYVNVSFGSLFLLRTDNPLGMHYVFLLFVCVWAADIFAYFGGRRFGGRFIRKKFFERLSPHKTWEGFVAGLAGSVAVSAVFAATDMALGLLPALTAGFAIGLLSPLGDLIESMFKRDAGVKDSSSLIPGHGGVLDRFDTVMFIAPLFYLLTLF